MKRTNKHRLLVRERLEGKPAFSCYSHEVSAIMRKVKSIVCGAKLGDVINSIEFLWANFEI